MDFLSKWSFKSQSLLGPRALWERVKRKKIRAKSYNNINYNFFILSAIFTYKGKVVSKFVWIINCQIFKFLTNRQTDRFESQN
jgi:hypothetical protein